MLTSWANSFASPPLSLTFLQQGVLCTGFLHAACRHTTQGINTVTNSPSNRLRISYQQNRSSFQLQSADKTGDENRKAIISKRKPVHACWRGTNNHVRDWIAPCPRQIYPAIRTHSDTAWESSRDSNDQQVEDDRETELWDFL